MHRLRKLVTEAKEGPLELRRGKGKGAWGEEEGKGLGMLGRRRLRDGSSILRVKVGSLGEVLGEDLNRIFIKFMLMRQNEIYSPDFIRPWVRLALIGFLLTISLSWMI